MILISDISQCVLEIDSFYGISPTTHISLKCDESVKGFSKVPILSMSF